MRKFITSAGLIALSAAGTQAAALSGNGAGDKFWDVSLTVRGFYDDNYNTAQNGTDAKRSSYGVQVQPSVGIHFTGEQTSFGAHYNYDMRYYDDRKQNTADHSHEFNAWVMHAFSERFSVDAAETFTLAQEPELLDSSNPSLTTRANGNNVHNNANTDLHAQLTRLVEFVLGYDNQYYNYSDPGYAGLLNRMEQTINAKVGWQVQPETTVWLGYKFGWADYYANQVIGTYGPSISVFSKARNSRTHTIFAGLDHNFTHTLSAQIEVGAEIKDYYNNPPGSSTKVNPYADVGFRYTYMSGCFAQLGFRQQHTATDQISVNPVTGDITLDQEASIVYGSITHAITPKLIAKLDAQYAYGTYVGGTDNGLHQNVYSVSFDLAYHFTQHLSADVMYYYDRTDSSSAIGYSYDRNRVYLGMTASY